MAATIVVTFEKTCKEPMQATVSKAAVANGGSSASAWTRATLAAPASRRAARPSIPSDRSLTTIRRVEPLYASAVNTAVPPATSSMGPCASAVALRAKAT